MANEMQCRASSNFWIYFWLPIIVMGSCIMYSDVSSIKSKVNDISGIKYRIVSDIEDNTNKVRRLEHQLSSMDNKLDDLQNKLDELCKQKCSQKLKVEND